MSTILISGGAGYIGSHTLLEIASIAEENKKYSRIIIFDNLKNGHLEAVDLIRKKTGAEIILKQGDLLNPEEITAAFENESVEAVIHFAALIEAGISMVEPTRFFDNNISGTINLIKAMQKHNVRKLVFSSTAAVYGTPSETKVTENFPTKPENWYGFTKYVVENLLTALGTEQTVPAEKINTVILRYFNAAGSDPGLLIGQDYPRPTHLITLAIQAALGFREKITIFGNDYPTPDGTCIRDYIHVSDLAHAHVLALNYLESFAGSEIINIGSGKGYSNLEIIKKLEELNGAFNYEFGPKRIGDPVAYFADNSKAKEVLGWEPKYDLDTIIKSAYDWQKNYPKGFQSKVEELGEN